MHSAPAFGRHALQVHSRILTDLLSAHEPTGTIGGDSTSVPLILYGAEHGNEHLKFYYYSDSRENINIVAVSFRCYLGN